MSQAKNSDSTTPSEAPAGSAASKTFKKFGRRELLRGTGVAALAVGAAALVPVVIRKPPSADIKVFSLGEQCLKQVEAVRKVGSPVTPHMSGAEMRRTNIPVFGSTGRFSSLTANGTRSRAISAMSIRTRSIGFRCQQQPSKLPAKKRCCSTRGFSPSTWNDGDVSA